MTAEPNPAGFLDKVLDRRTCLHVLGVGLLAGCANVPRDDRRDVFRGGRYAPPVAVATWNHGKTAVTEGVKVLSSGGEPLDAVERGINLVELDPKIGSVGVGGRPNAEGVLQLDAAIMNGAGLRCGSVFALEGIDRPISVARRVMERTRHIHLADQGALRFASEQGFQSRDLSTPESRAAWEKWRSSPERRVPGQVDHDTVGMVALAADGRMAAGCSTSGLAWKIPGRVGDSPIIGGGLYCDDAVGGASATGIGEEVIRVCGSFLVVEKMRQGATPQEAVESVLERIISVNPLNAERQVAFVALSRTGEVGAASIRPGFRVAVAADGVAFLRDARALRG